VPAGEVRCLALWTCDGNGGRPSQAKVRVCCTDLLDDSKSDSWISAALPSIGFLDTEKIKREEAEYQRRNAAVAMVSPSFPFSCPPPPYSHPPTANAALAAQSGLISPPESRRTSGDEPAPIHSTRQSLPSIHEALGGSDPALSSYPPQTSAPPTSAPSFYQPPATSSMSELHRRSFTAGPPATQEPHPSLSHPSPHSPFTSRTPHTPHTPTSTADILSRPPLYAPHAPPQQHPKLPTLQPIRTGNSPVTSLRPSLTGYQQQQPSPAYDSHPAPQSAPATSQYSSGFPQFPQSTFSFNPPTPGSTYPGTAPPRYPPGPPTWRQDTMRPEDRQQDSRMAGMPLPYGESVKRHLDNFDLEASLNEVRLLTCLVLFSFLNNAN
jgi:hypothetical protein